MSFSSDLGVNKFLHGSFAPARGFRPNRVESVVRCSFNLYSTENPIDERNENGLVAAEDHHEPRNHIVVNVQLIMRPQLIRFVDHKSDKSKQDNDVESEEVYRVEQVKEVAEVDQQSSNNSEENRPQVPRPVFHDTPHQDELMHEADIEKGELETNREQAESPHEVIEEEVLSISVDVTHIIAYLLHVE